MIEQTWWDTPWIAIYFTYGRAVLIAIIILVLLALTFFIGYQLGKGG